MRKILSVILLGVLVSITTASASDIRLEAAIDRSKVALGDALQLNLSFYGAQNISAPDLGQIEGFDVRYLGPSTMVSIVNSAVTSSITHIYTLVPSKTGTFTLGPFSVDVQGKTLSSRPITVEVVSSLPAGQYNSQGQSLQEPAPARISSEELKDRIFLIVSTGKRKAFLNEVIPVTVKLYVNRLAVRDIQFPVLETNDFSVEKFEQPKQYREEFSGISYDVIEFNANMFAIKAGDFTLGPVKLKCNLVTQRQSQRKASSPFDDDFFGGFFKDDIFDNFLGKYDTYPLELSSTELPVTVLALPQEGKPEEFDGALGNFQLEVEATPLQVKAGDPVTLKMTLKGEGNFDTVRVPRLQSKEGFKVYDPQVKQAETEKVFEQVLIPESEKITHIPEINFSFFNTETGLYQILKHEPIPIIVAAAQEPQAKLIEPPESNASAGNPDQVKTAHKEELGRDIIYIKGSAGKLRKTGSYLYQNFGFWVFQVISLVLFIGIILIRLEQQKLASDQRYARRLRAPNKARKGIQEIGLLLSQGKEAAFFDAVFKTMREYLADRFHLPAGGITANTIEEITKEKAIPKDVVDKIKSIFADCDMARYAPGELGKKQLEDILRNLKESIDFLEKNKI